MLTLADLAGGVLLPAVVTAVLLLLARFAGGRTWGGAVALGAGYLSGHLALRGWRGWVPRESADWIAAAAACGLLAGAAALTRRGPAPLSLLLRWLLALGAAWVVAGRALARRGEVGPALGWMAVVAAGAALAWTVLESRREAESARPSALASLLLLIAVGCAAPAIGLSGSQLLAQLAGALAATLAAAMLATRQALAPPLLPSGAGVVVLVLLALLLAACVHARLPTSAAVLLALAAVVPAPAEASGPRTAAWIVRPLVSGLLGGAAVGLAWQASPPLDF